MKLLFVVNWIIVEFLVLVTPIPTYTFAEEIKMKLVSYEEVADCKYPSIRICYKDDNGQSHCVVKQDERCN